MGWFCLVVELHRLGLLPTRFPRLVNRPGVAGAVLQSPPLLTDWLIDSSFIPKTIRARELKFWENVHPTPCVMCHLSPVTCYLSHVICHVSPVMCYLSHVTCHVSPVTCQMSNVKKICLSFLIIVPGGPWGSFMGLVGSSLGPSRFCS